MQSDWLSLLLTMKLCLCCLIFCEQATVSSSYPSFPLFLFFYKVHSYSVWLAFSAACHISRNHWL